MNSHHVLHVFNPEHDLALARNMANFTAPHAALSLRGDIGFLPALWSHDGDLVAVRDVCEARDAFERVVKSAATDLGADIRKDVEFVACSDLQSIAINGVDVWGWDINVRNELVSYGVNGSLVPSDEFLVSVRELSHRRHAARILSLLDIPGTVGEALVCDTESQVRAAVCGFDNAVLKAPWSCSGRGLRFVSVDGYSAHVQGWVRNIIRTQGCVMVECRYDKVIDFGMEFYSNGDGTAEYLGLSVFDTENGAYTGNVIASESFKRNMVTRFVPETLLCDIKDNIISYCGSLYKGRYEGFFGVDMMVVRDGDKSGYKVHPCVEINLRRTMGHVSLALAKVSDPSRAGAMVITSENKYQLDINNL